MYEFTLNDVVDKYHIMDPETDMVLANSARLKNGMQVLVEDPEHRGEKNIALAASDKWKLMIANRWCTVSQLSIDPMNDLVVFVGVYSHGVSFLRKYDMSVGWLAKMNSIPNPEPKTDLSNDAAVYHFTEAEILELDRCARAYGWEIRNTEHNAGMSLPDVVPTNEMHNPFAVSNWRKHVVVSVYPNTHGTYNADIAFPNKPR